MLFRSETGITHPRAQPAMECEAALPRELSKEDCVKLVRGFAHDMWVKRGVAVDLAIHRTKAGDGGEHPHVHFLIATRRFEPSGKLGKAARDMQDNPQLVAKVYALEKEGKLDEALLLEKDLNLGTWRAAWAEYTNRFLTDAGSKSRIDHRTLTAQGIAREAMPYLGMAYNRIRSLTEGLRGRVEELSSRAFRNGLRGQLQAIQQRRPHLMAEFIALAQQYGQKLFPELQPDAGKGVGHDR